MNNAGTAIPKPFEETTLEEMDRVIDINIRGVFVATQAALKHMKSGGRIIMIGSAVGERVRRPACALRGHEGSRQDVHPGAGPGNREPGHHCQQQCNRGRSYTELNPRRAIGRCRKSATALNRYGQVDDIAAMVAFVAGPEASYITGANLTVDGGMNA